MTTTLEARRRATRPGPRHQPQPTGVSLFCLRCDVPFHSRTLTRECPRCAHAGEIAFGAAHLSWEISGL